jgi:cytochrome P450
MVNNVDQLLTRWRADDTNRVHRDIVQQCQHLVLSIFGFIAFDYDLETLDGKDATGNELTLALQDFVTAFQALMFLPFRAASLYWKINPRYRRARKVIQRYLYQMMEQELAESEESRTQRKRTCLVASLVSSLQKDEILESKKSEEEKQGK